MLMVSQNDETLGHILTYYYSYEYIFLDYDVMSQLLAMCWV